MNRISGPGTTTIAGGHVGFVNRNLGSGIPGTQVQDVWLNGVQEELLNWIESAFLTPSGTDFTQTLAAARIMFGGGGALASNGWVRLPAVLVSGAWLRPILQWGGFSTSSASPGLASVTFAVAFPSSCAVVIPSRTAVGSAAATSDCNSVVTWNPTASSFQAASFLASSSFSYIAVGF